MNLKQINEWRAAHDLKPLCGDPRKAAKAKQRRENLAVRAQESQALRFKRSSGKGK